MIRAAAVALVASSLGLAPLQCGSGSSPDPALRTEETAGDALWGLATKFHADGNDASAKSTLQFLVDRYPSSRHAPDAKESLARAAQGGALFASPAP